MFEVGWTEMLVIAIVMIVVVGPKDLPSMLRTFGRTAAKLRAMAGDFQKQFNDALKEAELDDVKKSVDALRGLNPASEIRKQLNPFEQAAADVRSGLDNVMKPKTAAEESPSAVAAEPLKGDATATPAAAMPEAAPAFPAMTDASVAAAAAQPAKETPAAKTTTKKSAPSKPAAARTAKVTVAKPAAAKPAQVKAKADITQPVATKAAPAKAKAATAKAATVKVSPAKPAKPTPEKRPATVKKKTAGAAK
jgi:sec-independent protein translocase protein TatB